MADQGLEGSQQVDLQKHPSGIVLTLQRSVEKQHDAIRNVFSVLCSRPEHVSNFVDAESFFGPDSRLVYKHFATLYFVFIFDSSENELAMLDLIQVSLS
ncbi:AP-3 complex subunit sigma [Glycine soja]|nr:AP-3 complex subunit sigma [Glycine soja]